MRKMFPFNDVNALSLINGEINKISVTHIIEWLVLRIPLSGVSRNACLDLVRVLITWLQGID